MTTLDQEILSAFRWLGIGTERECQRRLELWDIHVDNIRIPIEALIKEGRLEYCGECECPHARATAMKIRLTGLEASKPEVIVQRPLISPKKSRQQDNNQLELI